MAISAVFLGGEGFLTSVSGCEEVKERVEGTALRRGVCGGWGGAC